MIDKKVLKGTSFMWSASPDRGLIGIRPVPMVNGCFSRGYVVFRTRLAEYSAFNPLNGQREFISQFVIFE